MRVITTYYNPCKYKTKLNNYYLFRKNIEKNKIDLTTLELYGKNDEPQIHDSIKFLGDSFLWQKESLILNYIKKLKNDSLICWLDCDIIFDDNDWFKKTQDSLVEYDVVQLFDTVELLSRCGKKEKSFRSNFFEFFNNPKYSQGYPFQGHPGFAFAAKKDFIKFYRNYFVFSGDVIFCSSLTHDYWNIKTWNIPQFLRNDIINWCDKIEGKIYYQTGTIFHLWHGSWKDRQYNTRMNIINNFYDKIKINNNGFFYSDDDHCNSQIKKFMKNRKEDGIKFI